ncbi:MAG TPA: class I SAM-dependent methyltransferase [Methylomirabilota bacterium]|nr:class I SAM-dependent methyltransferase [Methylomirabilota bacterium]
MLKSPEEARATIAEWNRIDRGFLTPSWTLAFVLILVVALIFRVELLVAAVTGTLASDFVVFCVCRARTLARYKAGQPRLVTAADWASVSRSYRDAGVGEPTMSNWEIVAGHATHPQWRTDLRYKELLRHYAGGVVADIGCGDGRLCWRYEICAPRSYIGVDVSEGLLHELSARTFGAAGIVQGTAECTGLPSASVDFIACTEVFEHLPDPALAIREFGRVLRPFGKVVIQSPNATRLRNANPFHILSCVLGLFFPSVLLRKTVHENTFVRAWTYHSDFTRQDIRSFLQGSGLSVRLLTSATHRFNPDGSLLHRVAHRLSRLPLISWAWGDLTVVLQKGRA